MEGNLPQSQPLPHLLVRKLGALVRSLATVGFLLLNLLNAINWEQLLLSDVFGNKESCASIVLLSRLGTILWIRETHLVVTGWCEDILGLGLACQLRWEDLTLDVRVGTDVTDGQSDALAHDLSIQVVAFDLFLNLARQ